MYKMASRADLWYNKHMNNVLPGQCLPHSQAWTNLLRRLVVNTLPLHAQDGNTTFIYALVDPRTQQIRYVGKANDPQHRLRDHLREKRKSYKNSWIKELRDNGLVPELQIVEEVPVTNWMERERYWIAYYRDLGMALVNGTDGGDGVHGMQHTPEARAKISAAGMGNQHSKGRHPTPEETAKRRSSLKGHVVTPETREKIRASKLGVPRNPASVEKMRQSLLGRKLPESTVEKMRGRKQSPETLAKRSASLMGNTNARKKKTPNNYVTLWESVDGA